ncbi:MAG: TraB/GumN family protein [Gammaproteobacteria bacterium]|nr:TraB/GumN family protein [Gammaproteobacteria bacterium]
MGSWPERFLARVCALLLLFALLPRLSYAYDCAPIVEVPTPTDNIPFGRGTLFRISANGQVSHMFGTIHVSEDIAGQLDASVTAALSTSSDYLMEVVIDTAATIKMAEAMFFVDGTHLADVVDGAVAADATRLLAGHGVAAPLAELLQPWAAFMTLSMPKGAPTTPLDSILMNRAEQQGIAVHGLETIDEQLGIFTAMTLAEQREMLTLSVCHYDFNQAALKTLVDLYRDRDLAGMMVLSTRYQAGTPELEQDFMADLVWERNDRMVERMLPFLDAGGAFIAVGAMHLAGERGILNQLANRGFLIEVIH